MIHEIGIDDSRQYMYILIIITISEYLQSAYYISEPMRNIEHNDLGANLQHMAVLNDCAADRLVAHLVAAYNGRRLFDMGVRTVPDDGQRVFRRRANVHAKSTTRRHRVAFVEHCNRVRTRADLLFFHYKRKQRTVF